MCRDGGRNDDRLDRAVVEQIVEAIGEPRRRVPGLQAVDPRVVQVADPREVRELGVVACEVRAPTADSDLCDSGHSFHTFPFRCPLDPVAFLKSMTSRARSERLA